MSREGRAGSLRGFFFFSRVSRRDQSAEVKKGSGETSLLSRVLPHHPQTTLWFVFPWQMALRAKVVLPYRRTRTLAFMRSASQTHKTSEASATVSPLFSPSPRIDDKTSSLVTLECQSIVALDISDTPLTWVVFFSVRAVDSLPHTRCGYRRTFSKLSILGLDWSRLFRYSFIGASLLDALLRKYAPLFANLPLSLYVYMSMCPSRTLLL